MSTTPTALGVDVGGTKIVIARVDAEGGIEARWRFPTDAARGGSAVMAAIEEALAAALAESGTGRVAGIGISAAGQVDWRTGRIAYASPNIPGWSGTPVKERLEARFGLDVTVDNDANAAAYGEAWAGAGRGIRDLAMVTIGTGLGGGLIAGGTLVRGGRFKGGEVGHMVIQADGVLCNCGQRGCWEAYASGTAIARLAREAGLAGAPAAPEVFARAEAGDAAARDVLSRAVRYLAQGLVSLSNVLDPDAFVLGGGVASQALLLPLLREALADPAVAGARGFDLTLVRLAALGNDAGAVGAAGQVLHAGRPLHIA